MANVEQKRADLEKALAALDESEIEAVAGGLSEKGKKIMKGVAIGAGVVVGAGAIAGGGYLLHKHFKGKKEEVPTPRHAETGLDGIWSAPKDPSAETKWGPTEEEQNQDEFNTSWD